MKKRSSRPQPPPGSPIVWVGTMYSGEGDFVQCKQALNSQEDVYIVHHVIAHRPEKVAHNQLWQAWREFRDTNRSVSLFIKVDADTVLCHNRVIRDICDLFRQNERVTGIQCPLDDYFTAGHIFGLNCFSPRVVFQDTKDDLFCDRNVDVGHDVVLRTQDLPKNLVPAALHCHHATHQQAFHFGIHRALKNQLHVIEATRKAWQKNKDAVRAWALLGANMAHRVNSRFNYTDVDFTMLFHETNSNFDRLVKEILR